MATRRDQLQSYQFLTQRVISAFVMRETDPRQSPLRRGIGAVFGGIMIAIVVGAGFGIYGILTKVGSNSWRTDGAVVVEKETGASFVYFSGGLHPTLNYASAMLASGRPNPPVFRVAGKSLAGAPRGVIIGIPGAPDSLPTARNRVGLPWTLCAAPGTDSSGRAVRMVTLIVGGAPTGGRSLRDGGAGTLVRDATVGTTYLIWQGHRYLVREPDTIVPALFGAVVTAVPVGTAWLNALPAGANIEPIAVDRRGQPSPAVPGRDIGDLLVATTGSGPQYYLVFDDGLAPITALQEAVVSAQSPAQPAPISISDATAAPRSDQAGQSSGETQPPRQPPTLVAPAGDEPLCAVTDGAAASPRVWVGGSVEGLATATPTASVSTDGASLADRVHVPAGRVAVVRAVGAPGAGTGSLFVVTDLGIRYPVLSTAVLAMLGYGAEAAVDVPAGLVNKIPAGPTLDPAAATRPASVGPD